MAATPEKNVKTAIKKLLDKHGCWYYMPVPGGYGEATLDFLCARNGRMFAIEAKAPGKSATPRQRVTIGKMRKHKIPCWVEDSSTIDELEAWILIVTSE